METLFLQFQSLSKLENVAKTLYQCHKIINDLGVVPTEGDGLLMSINDENGEPYDGLKGSGPGCTWHPSNGGKGKAELLRWNKEDKWDTSDKWDNKPTCGGEVRENTSRRLVCPCQ